MSLYGALLSGVSALNANSQAMGVISDNISNLNTTGYKGNIALFQTLVSSDSPDRYTPGGVLAKPRALVDKAGILQSTSSATDLALSGNGFFVVAAPNDPTSRIYTRAGSFTTDKDGNLVNAAGYRLLGMAADTTGKLPASANSASLVNVNLASASGAPQATTSIKLAANLKPNQTVNPAATGAAIGAMAAYANTGTGLVPDFERSITVYDTLGVPRTLNMAFAKTSVANQWRAEVYSVPGGATTGANGLVASGTVTFNGDGTFLSTTLASPLSVQWQTVGASFAPQAPQAIALSFGAAGGRDGLTQVQGDSALRSATVDGFAPGSLVGVSVDKDGIISGKFSNGATRTLYRLPVATFTNANGLSSATGNVYTETQYSGAPTVNYANTGASASVTASALEGSTVDLASEFSNMITTQRAYSAASKIITTSDDMLDELIRIKR